MKFRESNKVGIWAMALLLPFGTAWADRAIDETKPFNPGGNLEIRIVSGSLVIVGSNSNEIHVKGTLGDDVEEFIFEIDDDEAQIRVKLPDRKRNIRGDARLEISVPADCNISANTISAPLTVRGITGEEIELQVISGKIVVEDCAGEIDAETVSGNILIDGNHSAVSAETVSGTIEINGAGQEVDANTVSGGIKVNGGDLTECQMEALSGSIRYEGGLAPAGQLDVEAFSGAVEILFNQEVQGRYEIETFNGRIENSFGPEPQRKNRFGPGYQLKFNHGDGDAEININTFSGRVVLKTK